MEKRNGKWKNGKEKDDYVQFKIFPLANLGFLSGQLHNSETASMVRMIPEELGRKG